MRKTRLQAMKLLLAGLAAAWSSRCSCRLRTRPPGSTCGPPEMSPSRAWTRCATGSASPTQCPRPGRADRPPAQMTRRFGPMGSCRIRVTLTAAVVADVPEDPVARTVRPASPPGRPGSTTSAPARTAPTAWRGRVGDRRTPGGAREAYHDGEAAAYAADPVDRDRARARVDPAQELPTGRRDVGQQLGARLAAARSGGLHLWASPGTSAATSRDTARDRVERR